MNDLRFKHFWKRSDDLRFRRFGKRLNDCDLDIFGTKHLTQWISRSSSSSRIEGFRHLDQLNCHCDWPTLAVWPEKSQMSIKFVQKWFHYKNDRFWHLNKNCIKCGRFRQINCCERLLKVAQSSINCPIWSHCTLGRCGRWEIATYWQSVWLDVENKR